MIPYINFSSFSLLGVNIQVWGTLASLGFLSALIISLREAKKYGLNSEIIWNVMTLALFGMILGSKIFYMIFYYIDNNKIDFNTAYGFNLIGGIIFSGIFSLSYILKYQKKSIKKILDILTPGISFSLIIIRIGCFLISDHVGKITNLPWGMEYLDETIRHPIALYHIIFLTFIFLIIIFLKKKNLKEGGLFFAFCGLYSLFRFLTDFFRCNDLSVCDGHFMGMTFTQWIIFPFLVFFVIKLFYDFSYDKIKSK